MLQNGPIVQFLGENILYQIFMTDVPSSPVLKALQMDLKTLVYIRYVIMI